MKILFFFTSFSQLNHNKYQLEIFNKINNINRDDLFIDIIIHNNNKDFNLNMIENSLDKNNLMKIKNIRDVKYIHTKKNIGYLWGAQEALSDNFSRFKEYDYVIHLNTNIYILNIVSLIDYLYDNLKNDIIFFVNLFRKNKGFRTNLTIFKPQINIYSKYKRKSYKKNLKPEQIPEKMLEYRIKTKNIKYTILPDIFYVKSDSKKKQKNNKFFEDMKIYHIHRSYNFEKLFE